MTQTEQTQPSTTPQADYFAFFNLPRKLALDVKLLEQSFYKKSRELHPDRFASAAPEKQQWSLEQSSLLNDAYRTLKAPLTRTEYLLKLEGMKLADESTKPNPPAELLEEVFELNMQLEEARMNQKMGEEDPQLRRDLESARENFTTQLTALDQKLETEWSRWDATVDAQANNQTPAITEQATSAKTNMAALLDRRRYIRNLVRDVTEALA